MWPMYPVSHLGHEKAPILSMAGVGGLMEVGVDGGGPQPHSCAGCRGTPQEAKGAGC